MTRIRFRFVFGIAVLCAICLRVNAVAASPRVYRISAASLRAKIASKRGHIVVVNFWATWCPGCVEEFPNLVRLQRRYGARGVDVIFVSADSLSDRPRKVMPFLAKKGVRRKSYIMTNDISDFFPAFDPALKSAYALPRTYVYNRRGHLAKVLPLPSSYASFLGAVKPLL